VRRTVQVRPSSRTWSQPPGRSSLDSATGCHAVSSAGSRLPRTGPSGAAGAGTGSATVSAVGRGGAGTAVRSGASHTQPCRSSTAQGTGRSARGGAVPSGPRDGMETQRPSPSNCHPWYGQVSRPSTTVPALSGTSRCGHRAGKALTSPPGRSRTSTYARPPAPTGSGVVPTSAARATGNQPVVVLAEGAMPHCSATGFPPGYGRRTAG
jgi:hypothetical protein